MAELCKGTLPPPGPGRETLATFAAFQMVRTIAFRTLMADLSSHLGPVLFATEVLQRAITAEPSLKQDGPALAALH